MSSMYAQRRISGASLVAVGIGLGAEMGASLVTQNPEDCLSLSLSFDMVSLPCGVTGGMKGSLSGLAGGFDASSETGAVCFVQGDLNRLRGRVEVNRSVAALAAQTRSLYTAEGGTQVTHVV